MKKKYLLFILLVALTAMGVLREDRACLAAGGRACVLIVKDDPGTNCLQIPINTGGKFVLEYLHSYSKFPVFEYYKITEDLQIALYKIVQRAVQCSDMIFPHVVLRDDGWMEVDKINRITPEVGFISGSSDLGNHKLSVGNKTWVLTDYFEGGSNMVLTVQRHETK